MDYKINIEQGLGLQTFDKSEDILNNIYLSLMVRKGSFFQNPDFGSRLHELLRMKNTEKTAALSEEYCKEALQWIIDIGRATKIDVYAARDRSEDLHRIKLLIEATQVDGRAVGFETYQEVA